MASIHEVDAAVQPEEPGQASEKQEKIESPSEGGSKTSLDRMMNGLNVSHSISKIGMRPFLDELGQKVLVLPATGQFGGSVSKSGPNKVKARKHMRKSEKTKSGAVDPQRAKQEYLEYLQFQSQLSAAALRKHILATHPKHVDEQTLQYRNWSICENLGSLINRSCCIQRRIHKINRSVGLGPSLYLLSLKAYILLFVILSLLSIPSIVVLTSGDQVKANGVNLSSIFELFARTTLGNIGYLGTTSCQHVNLAQNPGSMKLHCPAGVFAQITAVGLSTETEQDVCSVAEQALTRVVTPDGVLVEAKAEQAKKVLEGSATVFKNYVPLEPACSSFLSQDLRRSKFVADLEKQYDSKCRGQTQCTLDNL